MFDKTDFINLFNATDRTFVDIGINKSGGWRCSSVGYYTCSKCTKPWVSFTVPHKPCVVVHVCNLSTLELETVGLDSQGHFQVHRKSKSCLDYL